MVVCVKSKFREGVLCPVAYFQSVIVQMKEATDRVIGVIDADSNVISCSDTSHHRRKVAGGRHQAQQRPGLHRRLSIRRPSSPLSHWSAYFDYAVFADGRRRDAARSLCVMAYVALNGAKTYYEEKHDKGTFVKNIITDNILPGDIYIRAKELHFVTDVPRRRLPHPSGRPGRRGCGRCAVQSMFPDKQQDFVLSINETDIAVVKQVAPGTEKARSSWRSRSTSKRRSAVRAVYQDGHRHRHRRGSPARAGRRL